MSTYLFSCKHLIFIIDSITDRIASEHSAMFLAGGIFGCIFIYKNMMGNIQDLVATFTFKTAKFRISGCQNYHGRYFNAFQGALDF